MATQWLTCELVEELEQGVSAGRPVEQFVSVLNGATLSGLLEYGCAKLQCPSLPPLPVEILDSPLGRSLSEVRTELGLRASGAQRKPPRTITAVPHEFHVLEGSEPTLHRDWQEFLLRLQSSAKSVGFAQARAQGIAASLGEMADNATLHAQSQIGALVGYQLVGDAVVYCVADVGIGVLASLKQNEAYCGLSTHAEAIRTAIQDGTTRYGRGNGGFGFRNVFKSLASMWGTLRFRSGEGCLTMDGSALDADEGEVSYVGHRLGFQVSVCCRLSGGALPTPIF